MKSALIVLFVGIASCGQLFNPGQEYEYQYYGRLLTGIPQIDSTYAGLALKGKVLLQAHSQTSYKLQMKDVSFGTYNEKLSGPEPKNWRSVEVEANTPLSSEYKQMLESPVEFQVENGEIKAVKLWTEEPTWSVNMKKALISSLKIQLPQQQIFSQEQQSNEARNPKFWYIQQQMQQGQQQSSEQGQYFWSVMEEGIEGKCENTYYVSELPEYMIHEYEQGMIRSDLCQSKKYWQVLRTRDITKCQDSSIFLASKGHKNCLVGNCETENTKQTQTRYFGCGQTVEDIQLHGMINEGEMRQSVVAFNTEHVVTGTKQVLKLKQIRQVSNNIPEVQSPRTCHDLTYEYPQLNNKQVSSRQNQREILRSYAQQPRSMTFMPEIIDQLSTQETKTQFVQKIQKIAQQLEDSENFAEKEIPAQLKSLKVIVSVMKTDDIKEMFNTVKSIGESEQQKQTVRNLFFDIVRNAGSPSTVMFLKEMIEEEQLTQLESYIAITTLAHYIKFPSEELINQIFQLVKSPSVQNKFWLKGSAHLVFANIVRNACLRTASKSVYPEQVFGKMCSSKNQRIIEEYIPHLVQDLKNAQTSVDKQIALYALGQLGHESVIPLLVSYVEGKTQDSTVTLRKNALYALSDVANHYRNELLPVFLAIVHNPAESRTLRIPAIAMVMKMQPETVHLQKIAVSTWWEQDHEVARYVYATLREQAYLNRESHPEGSYLRDLSDKAQDVLPLAKPFPMIFSTNQIYSGYLPKLQIGAYMLNSLMTLSQGTTEFYHKTEYFLKQVQSTPVEFAFHMSGMTTIVKDLMKSVTESSSETLLHPQLKELIEKLEISPRQDSKFELGAWLRLSDDINFAAEINHETVHDLKKKVLTAVKHSGFSVMNKICGRTPINHQNVFEELPYQALVPSDLGLPIIVESQMTYFYSLQGQMNVDCSFNKPSASLEVATKMSYTYNGYAGTVSPFTQELLAAGINIHRASNMPVKTTVEVEPSTAQLKVSMTQNEQVRSNSQSVDVHHYHVKPYVVRKPIVFKDMTPAIMHSNTKIIRSSSSPKSFEKNFGQSLGLDMSVKVETECDVFDTKTMVDSLANFNYNPVAASWFFFAETALTSNGRPTARYHRYTVVHNPSRSSTKAAEMNFQFSLASQLKGQQPRKIHVQVGQESSHLIQSQRLQETSRKEERLGDCLRKIDADYGYAINAHINAKLIGGQPKTYTYSITAGAGQNTLEHKWNVHFENDDDVYMKRLCIDGKMQYPTTPSTDAQFRYSNKFSFGETCDQYYVNVQGQSQVSSKQRQISTISDEAKKCTKVTEKQEELLKKIKNLSVDDKETRHILEKLHKESAEKIMKFCSKKTDQSRSLDKTEFTITTSQDLPSSFYHYARRLNTVAKAVFFQYLSEVSQPTEQNKVQLRINFDQRINTVTVKVESPEENVVFRNIRVPYELREVVPFVAGKSPLEQSYKAITGKRMYPKCVLGQGYVQTFDKKTYNYQVDECDHLISSDCSKDFSHAIMAKEINGLKYVTFYNGLSKIELSPAEAYSSYVDEYVLRVDGKKIDLVKNERISLKSSSSMKPMTAYWSNDNTVIIETSHSKITHLGKTVSIEEKCDIADGSHCGLCGDYNLDKRADVKSPKGCIFSSDKLAAQSYRSKSDQCRPLSQHTLDKIRSEEQKCVKYETKKTSVRSVYQSKQQSSQVIKKHTYIHKEDKVCFSKFPVSQCSSNSYPKEMSKKTVEFVCLPEGRVADLYIERIERGENPQELRHQAVAFKAQMDQPISCQPRQV